MTGVTRGNMKTDNNSSTTMTDINVTTQITRAVTTTDITSVTDNSTTWNITSYENTNAPLAAIIAGTITGSLFVIASIVLLLVVCQFSKRNVKKAVDRSLQGHIYVNHGVVAHSIEDASKTGIPRNISWKSLEQTNGQENNNYCLAKDVGVTNTMITNESQYEQAKAAPISEEQVSGTDDNYFILEKIYMNNGREIDEDYYENCVQQQDNVNSNEMKGENCYSFRKVSWADEREKSKSKELINKDNISKGQGCIDDDVYNVLGENSRNNSVVSALANYDTMEHIIHEHRQIQTEEIYCNGEDYSDNYDVLQYQRKSGELNVIPDEPYSTTEQIKNGECP